MKHNVTHSAWFLLCPIWLASSFEELDTPIPRYVPDWWFDFNLWLNDCAQWIVHIINPDCVGYMFYGIKQIEKPFEINCE